MCQLLMVMKGTLEQEDLMQRSYELIVQVENFSVETKTPTLAKRRENVDVMIITKGTIWLDM